MPALELFGKRWRIGSDDLVFPGILEIIIRIVWLGVVLGLFIAHEKDYGTCKGSIYLRIYLIGVMVLISVAIIITVFVVMHSMRGTILNAVPRKHVFKLIILRLIFGLPEITWNILGTMWLITNHVNCDIDSVLWDLVTALVICTWVAIGLIIIGVIFLFEPVKHSVHDNGLDDSPVGVDENSTEAFKNVADVLASLLEENNLVASDIAAGLILLRLKRKKEEITPEDYMDGNLGTVPNTSVLSNTLDRPIPEWMTISSAQYFMKFALASYGWPWFLYGGVCQGSCLLWKHLHCCSRFRNDAHVVLQDNCCLCHTAALKEITGLEDESLSYISFHNKIYEVPFFVAMDDKSKNIIISIRGTLSLHDTITDLNAMAIKGITQSALYVYKCLAETDAIEKVFSRNKNYGIVVTGHSLGAGAAVILTVLLRPKYPQIKCFAFSPPGGLCSKEFSLATQEFVMTVITGDDLVPRLSVNSIYRLHSKIVHALEGCQKPKYRLLARGCWFMLFGISKSYLISSDEEGSASQNCPLLSSTNPLYSEKSSLNEKKEESESSHLPKEIDMPLFLPGNIVHIYPVYSEEMQDIYAWNWKWMDYTKFDEILISPNILRHHLPQFVLSVLKASSLAIESA